MLQVSAFKCRCFDVTEKYPLAGQSFVLVRTHFSWLPQEVQPMYSRVVIKLCAWLNETTTELRSVNAFSPSFSEECTLVRALMAQIGCAKWPQIFLSFSAFLCKSSRDVCAIWGNYVCLLSLSEKTWPIFLSFWLGAPFSGSGLLSIFLFRSIWR